jgi:hypothetical protein
LWLAGWLAQQGRRDEAVQVLTALATNVDADECHGEEARSMLRRWASPKGLMMSGLRVADAVRTAWQQCSPQCPPVAHSLRSYYHERWVRFHSLPGSKRYVDTAEEYATILDRHNTLLTELTPGPSLVLITCEWTDQATPLTTRTPLLAGLDPNAVHCCTVRTAPMCTGISSSARGPGNRRASPCRHCAGRRI